MKNTVYLNNDDFKKQNVELGTDLPYSDDISKLNESGEIGGHHFANRLVCQAMEGCDGTFSGDWRAAEQLQYGLKQQR